MALLPQQWTLNSKAATDPHATSADVAAAICVIVIHRLPYTQFARYPAPTASVSPPSARELAQTVSGCRYEDQSDRHCQIGLDHFFHGSAGQFATRVLAGFRAVSREQIQCGRSHTHAGVLFPGPQPKPAAKLRGQLDDAIRLAQRQGIRG